MSGPFAQEGAAELAVVELPFPEGEEVPVHAGDGDSDVGFQSELDLPP
jgi:hypothetical protein